MNMLLLILSIIAVLCLVGIAGYAGWTLYLQRKGADDPGMEVSYLRPPPIINTPYYGPVVPLRFDPETQTSGHATVRDTDGRLRTLSPVELEELHPRNMFQVVFGSGPAEFDWIPADHARKEQERHANRSGAVADSVHNKHKFDIAQTEAVMERENRDQEIDKALERQQAINKTIPGMVKK